MDEDAPKNGYVMVVEMIGEGLKDKSRRML